MTKKLLIITTTVALLLSGCAQNASDSLVPGQTNLTGTDSIGGNVNGMENGIGNGSGSGTDALSGNTVSISENNYGNESANTNGIDASGNYNSSSNGFKSIYFAFGKYVISSGMEARMRNNLKVATRGGARIKLEGNCDEFGTDEYNYALGLKRAKAVKDSLIAQGVASRDMVMVSFGESSPVCQTPSEACYKRNRRVDLRLVR
jgi:peptidoglycan-associated lipoprotein